MILINLVKKYREFILYGIIGGFCSALDFGVYMSLSLLIPYLWANIVSVHCGIFCSFILNRNFNFKVKDSTARRFFVFYMVGLAGLGISELLIYIMVGQLEWNHIIAKLITVVVVALFQFVLNKYITFKHTDNGKTAHCNASL